MAHRITLECVTVRIEASKALLENTKLRVSEILDRAGYADDSSFRRHSSAIPVAEQVSAAVRVAE
jgi:AraC-like DNA-binding protein